MEFLRYMWWVIVATLVLLFGTNQYEPKKAVAQTPQEEYITIWRQPSLDEKAGWCRADKQCQSLAEAVVYEARGERDMGKYAVAWVIRNRAEAERWPDTIRQVIHQYRQFSYLQDKHRQKTPTQKDWTTAYVVGYDVLNDMIESPVNDANHYHTIWVKPYWAGELEYVVTIGNHVFYR